MTILPRVFEAARSRRRVIVLPEGTEPRILQAARRLYEDGLARPILLGAPDGLSQHCCHRGDR